MIAYVLRRLVFAVVLVVTVSSASLLLTRLAPGDYATEAVGLEGGRRRMEEMRARYGLDRPLVEQYGQWIGGAVRFDFGRSRP